MLGPSNVSIKVMNLVWESLIPAVDLVLCLALADFADDDGGSIYPSVSKLAQKTRSSPRTVSRRLALLREQGIIEVVDQGGGRGHSTEYRFNLNHAILSGFVEKTMTTVVINHDTGGINPVTGDASLPYEPSIEPSVNHQAKTRGKQKPETLEDVETLEPGFVVRMKEKHPTLDVEHELIAAMNHTAINKAKKPLIYLQTWLNNAAKYAQGRLPLNGGGRATRAEPRRTGADLSKEWEGRKA